MLFFTLNRSFSSTWIVVVQGRIFHHQSLTVRPWRPKIAPERKWIISLTIMALNGLFAVEFTEGTSCNFVTSSTYFGSTVPLPRIPVANSEGLLPGICYWKYGMRHVILVPDERLHPGRGFTHSLWLHSKEETQVFFSSTNSDGFVCVVHQHVENGTSLFVSLFLFGLTPQATCCCQALALFLWEKYEPKYVSLPKGSITKINHPCR